MNASSNAANLSQPCPVPSPNLESNEHEPCATMETPSSSNWHLMFAIPELTCFSDAVKEAVRIGVITSKARREIIQVLRTYITAHTFYLKSEQYNMVCQKLVEKYPKLRDDIGANNDCCYVSQHH